MKRGVKIRQLIINQKYVKSLDTRDWASAEGLEKTVDSFPA